MSDELALGHVVLVGAGNMGGAMLRRWPSDGGTRLTVIDPKPSDAIAAHMAERGIAHARSPDGIEAADILVVAVKPQMMDAVLPTLRPLVSEATVVVSIAAGTTIEALSDALGTKRVVRTIPNTPAMVGAGVTGAYAPSGIDRAPVEALLSASGAVVWVESEADIDKVTAVSGSGPAYVFHMVEALAAAGRSLGLAAGDAATLARQTIVGAGALLAASEEDAGTLRANVTSPNGTTAAALEVLMKDEALVGLMREAVSAAHARAVELGRGS